MREFLLQHFDEDLVDQVLNAKKYKRLTGDLKTSKARAKELDLELCKTLYEEYSMPIYKIAMLNGVSDATIRNYFIEHNTTKLKGHRVGKNSFNNYFEKIDSPDKAYFLGLIVADGNISRYRETNKKVSISLTEEDKYMLELLNDYGNFNVPIRISHANDTKPRYVLEIHSAKVYDDLFNLGIRERKSKDGMDMPNIPKEYMRHFIRGYFDGDGIAFKQGYIGFCGNINILSGIKDYLVSIGFSDTKIWFNESNNIHYMQWSKKSERIKMMEVIYKDKEDLYLKRKYEKLLSVNKK